MPFWLMVKMTFLLSKSSDHKSIIDMPSFFSTHTIYGIFLNFRTIDMVMEIVRFYIVN